MVNPIATTVIQGTKHAILRTISVVCVLLVIAGIWFAIDKTFIHPRKSQQTIQKAETIQNVEYNYDYTEKEQLFLGLRLWKIRLGITIR